DDAARARIATAGRRGGCRRRAAGRRRGGRRRRAGTPAVRRLPREQQLPERVRLVRRLGVAGLARGVDAVAARADADLAGLEAQPVALADDAAAVRRRELPRERAPRG